MFNVNEFCCSTSAFCVEHIGIVLFMPVLADAPGGKDDQAYVSDGGGAQTRLPQSPPTTVCGNDSGLRTEEQQQSHCSLVTPVVHSASAPLQQQGAATPRVPTSSSSDSSARQSHNPDSHQPPEPLQQQQQQHLLQVCSPASPSEPQTHGNSPTGSVSGAVSPLPAVLTASYLHNAQVESSSSTCSSSHDLPQKMPQQQQDEQTQQPQPVQPRAFRERR